MLDASSSLPLEILEMIVEKAGEPPEPDYSTLRTLCLTSSLLQPTSQRQIFKRIVLRPRNEEEAYTRRSCDTELHSLSDFQKTDRLPTEISINLGDMERIVESNPTIATYVRVLRLQTNRSLNDESGFVHLMSKLVNIQRITIEPAKFRMFAAHYEGTFYATAVQAWSTMSKSVRQCLQKLIESPSMTEIIFGNLEDIPSIILIPCTNLSRLRIRGACSFTSDQSAIKSAPLSGQHRARPLRLKTLEFQQDFQAIASLLTPGTIWSGTSLIDVSSVTDFAVTICSDEDVNDSIIADLISQMDHLTDLDISTVDYSSVDPCMILSNTNVGSSKTLRRLTLRYSLVYFDYDHVFPAEILKSLPELTGLTELHITVILHQREYETLLLDDLRKLDELLATQQFSSLRQVSVSMNPFWIIQQTYSGGEIQPFDMEKWRSLAIESLHRLSANPLVKSSITVT